MSVHRPKRDGYTLLEGASTSDQPNRPQLQDQQQAVQGSGHAPAREFRRSTTTGRPAGTALSAAGAGRAALAPGQQLQPLRQKDKFVPLPDDVSSPPRPIPSAEAQQQQQQQKQQPIPSHKTCTPPSDWESDNRSLTAKAAAERKQTQRQHGHQQQQQQQHHHHTARGRPRSCERPEERREPPPSAASYRDLEQPSDDSAWRGRITVYCIAEQCDRKTLLTVLKTTYPDYEIHEYSDVLHVQTDAAAHKLQGEVFFFDYGVIVCWGLTEAQEQSVLMRIGSLIERAPLADVEVDELEFNYSANQPPHIQNDTITINKRQAGDHQVRLAISHALAQSTKLSVYEERVMGLVEETRYLPEALAKNGHVTINTKQVAQLIGKVFLQNSNVNLLSTVLDTPEFFWRAPDSLSALYERACEYLELESRVEVLNARFQVLQEMLDMLRDHQNHGHAARLEWIIIWLLVVDVVLMLFQLASLFSWF